MVTATSNRRLPARNDEPPFALTKWYVDCVAPDGRVVIGYWASLAWRHLAFTWQRVVLHEPGKPPRRRSSLVASPPPDVGRDAITWRAPPIGCSIDVTSWHDPIEQRLLDDGTGIVDWRVDAPAALVSVALDGCAPVHGPGYAERLFITVPPWRLPIRELCWGRWIDDAASRSVVWIDWRGASPRSWVFVDGVLASEAEVTDERVRGGAAYVKIGQGRTLEAMAFSQIAGTIPPLRAVLPKSLLAIQQTRWCSEATLLEENAPTLTGRAIHEVAVFG